MIRIIYEHYCDSCHNLFVKDEYDLVVDCPIPHPSRTQNAFMSHLCDPCAERGRKALWKELAKAPEGENA